MKKGESKGRPVFIYEAKGAVVTLDGDEVSVSFDTEDGYVCLTMTKDTATDVRKSLRKSLKKPGE